MGKTHKKKPDDNAARIARPISFTRSELGIVDELRGRVGKDRNRFLIDCAIRNALPTKTLPASLQTEMAISIFTMRRILEIWIEKGESKWLREGLAESVAGALDEGADFADKEKQAEIATAILTIDAAMKAYLERAGLGALHKAAHNEARIRVLGEMEVG